MSNTRRTAVRISTAFAATALLTVAGGASAQAAIDPGVLPLGSVTTTVTGLTGNLPIVSDVLGGATGGSSLTSVTSVTKDVPVVGGLLGGDLLGGDLPGGDLLGGDLLGGVLGDDDGLLETVTDDVLEPVLDTVDELLETVVDDVVQPVLDSVSEIVDDVTDTVDDLLAGDDATITRTTKSIKVVKHRNVSADGASPSAHVQAGSLPHTGSSDLTLYLLAGGAALAAGGAGLRRFVIRAGG